MKKNHSCYRRRYLKHIALVLLFYPLSALGAQGHISIKGQSITIMQAIQLIEKNSDYTFFYNAADLEDKQRKDINCNGPIDEILDEVFKDSGISYIVKNKEVILNVQKTNNTQQKKKRTVTGTIIDAVDDSPIIGANITIKGDKNTGTISDIDGNFSLSIPDNKTILVVTYIGYKTREVPEEDLGNIKIVLEGSCRSRFRYPKEGQRNRSYHKYKRCQPQAAVIYFIQFICRKVGGCHRKNKFRRAWLRCRILHSRYRYFWWTSNSSDFIG